MFSRFSGWVSVFNPLKVSHFSSGSENGVPRLHSERALPDADAMAMSAVDRTFAQLELACLKPEVFGLDPPK